MVHFSLLSMLLPEEAKGHGTMVRGIIRYGDGPPGA
jgi:hypothetical protein